MNNARVTAVLSSVAALAVTACAGSAISARNTAATVPGATCAQANGIIQNLVNAQAVFNASQKTETDDVTYIEGYSGRPVEVQADYR
jgi:hypothetical protein